jgi:hypothetical protein
LKLGKVGLGNCGVLYEEALKGEKTERKNKIGGGESPKFPNSKISK